MAEKAATFDFGTQGLIEALPDALRDTLQSAGTPVRYEDGQQIHSRGDLKPGLSIVQSGAVRIGNVGRDGSYMPTAVFGPGQTFGEFTLFADLPRTHDAEAVGNTVVVQVNRSRFERVMNDQPDLRRLLLSSLASRLHHALEFIDDIRRLPLAVRVAKALAVMASSDDPDVTLHVKQSILAETMGVSRVSLGKALEELEKAGLLSRGYGAIHIPDRPTLHAWIDARAQISPLETTSRDRL